MPNITTLHISLIIPDLLSYFITHTNKSTAAIIALYLTCSPPLVLILFPHNTKLELYLTTFISLTSKQRHISESGQL